MNDAELITFAKDFRNGLLGRPPSHDLKSGDGYIVCAPLAGVLAFHGVKTGVVLGLYCGISHTWLELEDGRILDPTVCQWNGRVKRTVPDVYLDKPDHRWRANATRGTNFTG